MNLNKRLIFAVLMLSILIMVAAPTFAQDVTAEATSDVEATATPVPPIVVNDGGTVIINDPSPVDEPTTPFTLTLTDYLPSFIAAAVIIGLSLFAGYALSKGTTPKAMYQSAPFWVQYPVKLGLEALINYAATTPNPEDDRELERLAKEIGYTKITMGSGRVILTSEDPAIPDLTVQRVNR